jgi:hypothetical protein
MLLWWGIEATVIHRVHALMFRSNAFKDSI